MPFSLCERLESYIPKSGRILDLGCGYGVFSNFLALKSQDREILGIDCIKERIRIAQEISTKKFNGRLEFRYGDILDFDIGLNRYDCIILLDVLCYISFQNQLQLLEKCYHSLRENSFLLIKDFDKSPIWKYGLFYLSDYLVNTYRIMFSNSDWIKAFKGRLFVRDSKELVPSLQKMGYAVEVIPFDKGSYESGIIYVVKIGYLGRVMNGEDNFFATYLV